MYGNMLNTSMLNCKRTRIFMLKNTILKLKENYLVSDLPKIRKPIQTSK